ncbi:MAG TPA: hypothetical protein PLQ21_10695, partial [Candidatus Kapabacteria bacterium]|nr:hypothetical protein [Candidatus Kapabacteria bacterium]
PFRRLEGMNMRNDGVKRKQAMGDSFLFSHILLCSQYRVYYLLKGKCHGRNEAKRIVFIAKEHL